MAEKIYISESPFGRGVFAKVAIQPFETLFYLTGRLINFREAHTKHEGEYSVQIGVDRYVDPTSPVRFMNHSCAPNAGFMDEIRLVTLTSIAAGEEICFDYSTTMLERSWELECECGAPKCRGRIQDFDLLPLSLQTHYLRLGIVQDFIVNEIESVKELAGRVA